MKHILMFGMVLVLWALPASAQAPAAGQKSPKEVVQEFWGMEIAGGQLTPEDWYKSSTFFIRPDPAPTNNIIHVISNNYPIFVDEQFRTENWAEVRVRTNELGHLDPTLRFERYPQRGPHGVLILKGPSIKFDLVLADRRWELTQDGAIGREVTSLPEWRIDCAESALWIDVDAAIHYVKEMRNKTTDPNIKKNADETLAQLMNLR